MRVYNIVSGYKISVVIVIEYLQDRRHISDIFVCFQYADENEDRPGNNRNVQSLNKNNKKKNDNEKSIV